MIGEFEARDFVVIAVAQEDVDLENHAKMRSAFEGGPKFELVADIGREGTPAYDRTTTYLIDKEGKVRQVFPQLITKRASWRAILNEADGLGLN